MRVVSWNVNGLRSSIKKGFMDYFGNAGADIFCIQETKVQQGGGSINAEAYNEYWNDAEKKGYAGTAVFSLKKPLRASYGIGKENESEGRVITLEFDDFFLINVYVPNSGEEMLKRLDYRMVWDKRFKEYIAGLDKQKKVIACGDFNVAHKETDIKNASSNRRHAGFTDEERSSFSAMLDIGFLDAFRVLYPDARDKYTYWSYFANSRARNVGWRIDYCLISSRARSDLHGFKIRDDVYGSDHCPIEIEIF